jgi:rubrerythrin
MADQRRRGGRGRSGRGGKIPRKGDQQQQSPGGWDEPYVSFPLEIEQPVQTAGVLDEAAVEAAFGRLLERERRLAQGLQSLAERAAEPVLGEIAQQTERHRDMLDQLMRDLGASRGGGEPDGGDALEDLLTSHRRARLEWQVLERIGFAAGDRRVGRIVSAVIPEKRRHAEVLEAFALQESLRALFQPPEE